MRKKIYIGWDIGGANTKICIFNDLLEVKSILVKNIKIWNLSSFNSSKTKNEILDFISYGNNRTIEKEFKKNTKLKSQRELILKKIKEWFSV